MSTETIDKTDELQKRIESLSRQLEENKTQLAEKDTILEEKNNLIEQQRDEIAYRKQEFELLQERIQWFINRRYRSKTEVDHPELDLFNEAETLVDEPEPPEPETTEVKAHKRRGKRQRLPEDLRRIPIEHDLPEAQKVCRCCGKVMGRIGSEKSEQLEIVPEKVVVLEHVRHTYACNHCHEDIQTADLPPQPIPKSNASPGLLAYIAVMKYMDGLPLHRIEKIFDRLGYGQSRTTLARWMIQVSVLCEVLVQRLLIHAKAQPHMHVDETTIQVLKEPDRSPQNESYMWVIRAGPPGKTVVIHHYDSRRSHDVLMELLDDYAGLLQCDGHSAYDTFAKKNPAVTLIGCFAHGVTKLKESVQAQKKAKEASLTKSRCMKGMKLIGKLYAIEEQIKALGLDHTQRKAYRQQHCKPVFQEIRQWIQKTLPKVAKQSLLGKAVHYLNNQWDKLIAYADHGYANIDNNPVEQWIRPFVLGRKAWMFSDTPSGANASAVLYTLVQTARINGIEPYRYLRKIFTDLPAIETNNLDAIDRLLPWNVDPAELVIPEY